MPFQPALHLPIAAQKKQHQQRKSDDKHGELPNTKRQYGQRVCAFEARMLEIDGQLVYTGVQDMLRRNTTIWPTRSSFKNCIIVKLPLTSSRGGTRNVSIKIFKNLTLHIAGCHSIEMIRAAVSTIATELTQSMRSLQGPLDTGAPIITMVNYAYSLPGAVQLQKLCDYLTDEHGMLVIFDPSKYAGANIKFPFTSSTVSVTDDGKRQRVDCNIYVSIMVFESRKIIISTPKCEERDGLLAQIISFIEKSMVQRWDQLRLL